MNTKEKLEEIFLQVIHKTSADELRDDMAPGHTEGWDSLAQMSLVSAIEETFGFEFDFDEMMELDSWSKIKELVIRKVGGGL